jgi:hypothetical protein
MLRCGNALITAIALLSFSDMACSFVFAPSPAWLAGRAGARPDHPISGRSAVNFAAMHNAVFGGCDPAAGTARTTGDCHV